MYTVKKQKLKTIKRFLHYPLRRKGLILGRLVELQIPLEEFIFIFYFCFLNVHTHIIKI